MTPEQMRDASMVELFRLEAQQQTQAFNDGLLVLERDPKQPQALETCMRAAHSLKGAARIVGLDVGVQVAHVMEDLLVAAIDNSLLLHSEHIDALLQGSDLLLKIGGVEDESLRASVDALIDRLQQFLRHPGRAPEPLQAQPVRVPSVEPKVVTPEVIAPAVEALSSAESETVAVLDEVSAPAPEAAGKVLRVTAERLDQLLDMSGKSLVQFQGVKSLNESLQRLKRLQLTVSRSLDGMRESLLQADLDERSRGLLDETRQGLLECQHMLAQHMVDFDEFAWQGGQRAQSVYDAALSSRMRPFADVLGGQTRMVRDIGRALGKQVRLEIEGEQTQVDRDVLERLEAPLTHLLRNALDHGIELPEVRQRAGKPSEGRIVLRARHHARMLMLELSDDGHGVDLHSVRKTVVDRGYASASSAEQMSEEELLAFLFLPGFSLRNEVTEISGRGVGLDAVQHMVRQLRGGVRMEQVAGYGSTFYIEVPLTLSVVRSLVVQVGDESYAFPLANIERMLRLQADEIVQLEGRQHFWYEERHVSLVSTSQVLQRPEGKAEAQGLAVVVIRDGDQLYGMTVDAFVGERILVVMPLDTRLGKVKDISAGALLEDGTPLLIIDVDDVIHSVRKLLGSGRLERVDRRARKGLESAVKRVLVVDDSLTVRELERKLLASRGYQVSVAVDGMDGWNVLRTERFDLLITDIDMPRMDGIELVTLVRRDPRLQSLPVMVVSYKDREEDRRRGLEAGADYYLAKASFHDEALLDAVQVLIGDAKA